MSNIYKALKLKKIEFEIRFMYKYKNNNMC